MRTPQALLIMAIVVSSFAMFSGCGGGSSSGIVVPTTGPTPVITCEEGHAASLGTTLHLSGTSSIALHPPITEYEWVVVQPAGNHAAFLPSASSGNVTFTPLVAGTYTFHLNIWDAQGGNVKVIAYVVTIS